jgi:hypothetical protein
VPHIEGVIGLRAGSLDDSRCRSTASGPATLVAGPLA